MSSASMLAPLEHPVAVRQLHALRPTRRARRVDQGGQGVGPDRGHRGLDHPRARSASASAPSSRSSAQLITTSPSPSPSIRMILVQVGQLVTLVQGLVGLRLVLGDQEPGPRVGHDVGEVVLAGARVDRRVRPASQHHRTIGQDPLDAGVAGDRHPILGLQPQGEQAGRRAWSSRRRSRARSAPPRCRPGRGTGRPRRSGVRATRSRIDRARVGACGGRGASSEPAIWVMRSPRGVWGRDVGWWGATVPIPGRRQAPGASARDGRAPARDGPRGDPAGAVGHRLGQAYIASIWSAKCSSTTLRLTFRLAVSSPSSSREVAVEDRELLDRLPAVQLRVELCRSSAWMLARTSGVCDSVAKSPVRPFSAANACSASGSRETAARSRSCGCSRAPPGSRPASEIALNCAAICAGGDVLAAGGLDQVLLAVGDLQAALVVELADVTGGQPAVGQQGLGVDLGQVAVAAHDVRAAQQHLAVLGDHDLGARAAAGRRCRRRCRPGGRCRRPPCSPSGRSPRGSAGRPRRTSGRRRR